MKIQAKGDYLLLKATCKPQETKAGIVLPGNDLSQTSPTQEKRVMIEKLEILAKGDSIKGMKVGDLVVPQGFVLNQKLPAENIGKKHEPEKIQYFWAKEEHIILVIK